MVERLGRRAQFGYLRARGTTLREGRLRIVGAPPPASPDVESSAVAYSISRRVGTAVRRNRTRRRLREIFTAAERDRSLPYGWYLVTVLPSRVEPTHAELEEWVRTALAGFAGRLEASDPGIAS